MKISLIAALTLDGFIARNSNEFASWTSKEDKKRFVTMTKEARCIVLGSKTFDTFPSPLPGRTHVIYSRNPENYRRKIEEKFGWKTIPNEIKVTNLNPKELISELSDAGFTDVMICGGSEIYTLFLESGIVTNLYITVEPVIFGTGISLFKREIEGLSVELSHLEKTETGTVFLDYQIKH